MLVGQCMFRDLGLMLQGIADVLKLLMQCFGPFEPRKPVRLKCTFYPETPLKV